MKIIDSRASRPLGGSPSRLATLLIFFGGRTMTLTLVRSRLGCRHHGLNFHYRLGIGILSNRLEYGLWPQNVHSILLEGMGQVTIRPVPACP